ncbi:MAG: aspartate aminotransferase family protein [Treponema sp.]|jgi:acetylornithine/N-succinyldiaminopimelate aminotransferase|nr:aspartate aminotransferase family protein [Treponema sp.]
MSDCFMNTYRRLPATFTRGEGAFLFDEAGRRFLDFTSGIAVNCLGHAYPPLVKAISEQSARFNHVSNYFQSDVAERFARKLVEACSGAGMKKVFLGNSGAEANEAAFKIARKYSLKKYGPGRHMIVTLKGSFHGRTITALSATGQDKFHEDFGPFTEGFKYTPAGDIPALDRALDSAVAGLLIEAVQGEAGVRPLDAAYVEAAAKLCAERDILLMFDDIQCGVGRTGSFLACEGFGVKPDVVTLAKGLAGGLPVGAALAGEKAADTLGIGDHGSTFGGNPLAAAAGLVTLETVSNQPFLKEIARKGEKLRGVIRSWNKPNVKDVRGKGLMIGVDIEREAWGVMEKALEKGVLLLSAGAKTLRFLPPYIISDEEIEDGLRILEEII